MNQGFMKFKDILKSLYTALIIMYNNYIIIKYQQKCFLSFKIPTDLHTQSGACSFHL